MKQSIRFFFHQAIAYWNYRRHAKTRYAVHSPFVFHFMENVLRNHTDYPEYERLKIYRKSLIKNNNYLEIKDLGSGSIVFSGNRRKIGRMARASGSSLKEQRLLFRLANYFNPHNILELGTHLGQSTMALALGAPEGKIISLEGAPALIRFTRKKLKEAGIRNVRIIEGNFDDLLPELSKEQTFDLVYIDGNHSKTPTLHYVELIKNRLNPSGFIVLDDIHWNKEMEKAWEEIIRDPVFHVTIDLFCCGLAFLRSEQQKEHFILKF